MSLIAGARGRSSLDIIQASHFVVFFLGCPGTLQFPQKIGLSGDASISQKIWAVPGQPRNDVSFCHFFCTMSGGTIFWWVHYYGVNGVIGILFSISWGCPKNLVCPRPYRPYQKWRTWLSVSFAHCIARLSETCLLCYIFTSWIQFIRN